MLNNLPNLLKKSALLLLLLASFSLTGAKYPAYTGYVNDYAHILSASDVQSLNALSAELAKKTGVQLATVIIPSLKDENIDDYAIKLFETWGIGQKGKDNGLLFIVALQERKTRIEVGYGLEGSINDAKAGRILTDYVIPQFKSGSIRKGVINGHLALAATMAKAYNTSLTGEGQPQTRSHAQPANFKPNPAAGFLALILICGIIFLIATGRGSWLMWILLFMLSSGRGGGNNNSFGGFGGDSFGGFGGGLSGGGGAGSSW
jgi:uncharacterized protein